MREKPTGDLNKAIESLGITANRIADERNSLLALLREFVEMDIPCPFRGNDGRLKDFAEWYKNVQTAIAKAEGRKP